MQEYIDNLMLPLKGTLTGNKYELEWTSSDVFDKFYLILSRHEFIELDEDQSSLDMDRAHLHFVDEENGYNLILDADYENDKYTCVVEKR